jgi:hypothetical protein
MTTATGIDMTAHYSVRGYGGIAFYLLGYDTEWTPEEWILIEGEDPEEESSYLYNEPEEIPCCYDRVRAVMVGDDHVHSVDVDDLTVIGELDYCAECGQIGCAHDGRDRD